MLDGLLPATSQRASLEKATAMYAENVEALASYLGARGISRGAATSAHLGHVSEPATGHERFVGMMSVPYVTGAGVVSIKFRSLDPDAQQRYDSPSGQHAHLYNVGVLTNPKNDTIVICEGELDALVCTHEVGIPAVGTPGTTWLKHWPRCFADVENVIVVADNDVKADGSNPGMKHAKDNVLKALPRARLVTPPPGFDIGEWFLAEGREAVRKGILGE